MNIISKVRQVTHVQASWVELERGAPGMFTFQLILDNPTAEDAGILLELL